MTNAVPEDFDASDGWDDDWGCEVCPACERQYPGDSGRYPGDSGYHGAVYDSHGRRFEHLSVTDPGAGPYFCADCWPELETNRKAAENRGLGEFA